MKVSASTMIDRLERLAGSGLGRTKEAVVEGGLALTRECFDSSTDPYGVSWPGLKRPRPGGPVEVETGAMRDGVYGLPILTGVRFVVPAPYAVYQHEGTRYNPQRRLLPVRFLGLPQRWRDMIRAAYVAEVRHTLLGGP